MPFVTMEEYDNTKVYALDNKVYRQIERAFVLALGDRLAARMLDKFAGYTLRQLSTNSYVDVLSAVTIL